MLTIFYHLAIQSLSIELSKDSFSSQYHTLRLHPLSYRLLFKFRFSEFNIRRTYCVWNLVTQHRSRSAILRRNSFAREHVIERRTIQISRCRFAGGQRTETEKSLKNISVIRHIGERYADRDSNRATEPTNQSRQKCLDHGNKDVATRSDFDKSLKERKMRINDCITFYDFFSVEPKNWNESWRYFCI